VRGEGIMLNTSHQASASSRSRKPSRSADAAARVDMGPVRCPTCGQRVQTRESMLGGRLIGWHDAKPGQRDVVGKDVRSGKPQCGASGSVLPTKKNPRAL
jgi:hypothetical protein